MGSMSILHSGWLQKMPHASHTFSKCRKRWFVLRSTKDDRYLLEYFNEPSSTKAKGSIDLSQCKSITPEGENGRNRYHSFVLQTNERQYNLSAESYEDYMTWIQQIAKAVGIKNPLAQPSKRSTPAPLKSIPPQESGGSLSSGPRTADSTGGKDKETSPYIPLLECRTGAKWTSADRTSPDPIMDDMRRMNNIEMNNNLAARPAPPSATIGSSAACSQSQFNYDVPRNDSMGTYSVPKSCSVSTGDVSAYSVPRPLPADLQSAATYSLPKSTPVPLDILTKSPPVATINPPEIRTDHYLVPTNNAAVGSRLSDSAVAVLGSESLSYDVVPPPVTLVNAPPRPPKPPGLRGSCDGHSLCEDNNYDIPVAQNNVSNVDGGAGRIYGNARDMSTAAQALHCTPAPASSAFLPDSADLIHVVPPAVNRRLKPKPPHEPVTPPSATIASAVPRRMTGGSAGCSAGSGGPPTPPPVPIRNNNNGNSNGAAVWTGNPISGVPPGGGPQHFFPLDFRKPSITAVPTGSASSVSSALDSLLPADGDGHELQYLDLGNAEPSTPSPRTPGPHGSHHHASSTVSTHSQQQQQSQVASSTSPQIQQSSATEYKELDFVKTRALNETRQNVNKSYRAQLEEAH